MKLLSLTLLIIAVSCSEIPDIKAITRTEYVYQDVTHDVIIYRDVTHDIIRDVTRDVIIEV